MYDIDIAQFGIEIAESGLYPTVGVQGTLQHSRDADTTLGTQAQDLASILGTATVPLYDGGLAPAQIRQAKELAAHSRLVLDQVRNQTQTAVISAWATHEGAKIALAAAEAEVRAANVALAGVQKRGAGRPAHDVLNAQQDLMAASARLIGAQRDRVIAAYTLLSAVGRLDVNTLGLKTPDYAAETHYHQVRDAWKGVRTPSDQ
jgi:outer membrane protein